MTTPATAPSIIDRPEYDIDASYDPADDKIRLRAATRLDEETYRRVKAAGFGWAPKQECFYAIWGPEREDLAIELAGDIEEEGTTRGERAAARAERFADYQQKRARDAEQARRAVSAIADNIPLGQPILVGHHSERHARRDAEKIENGMRKAVKAWETSAYWQQRAAACLANAQYLERPEVRARRIKKLESERRGCERAKAEAETHIRFWSGETFAINRETGERRRVEIDEDSRERLYFFLGRMRSSGVSFRGVDGTSWYSAWDCLRPEGERYKNCPNKTVAEIQEAALRVQREALDRCDRWIAHLDNRLTYERAMLGESGGLKADKFDLQPGGQICERGYWHPVVKVNRADGKVRSVTVLGHFASTVPVDEITDYRPPADGAAEKVKALAKRPPLCNYPGDGFRHMTMAEWKGHWHTIGRVDARGEVGEHRLREASAGHCYVGVYLTDAKRVDPPAAGQATPAPRIDVLPRTPRVLPAKQPDADPQGDLFRGMKQALKAGVKVVSAPQLFPTPPEIVERMVELADLKPGLCVLEPSAGTGNIVRAVLEAVDTEVLAYEINHDLCMELERRLGHRRERATSDDGIIGQLAVRCRDFLEVTDFRGQYPRILLNPPFANGQDIAHIKHAIEFLAPGGRLVAICANGPRQQEALRPLATTWEELPEGTFAEQGTNVRTVLLTVEK